MVRRMIIAVFVIAQCALSYGIIDFSGILTLSTPSGARSIGMGEVGTALADDEDVLYYNPAGLGMQNNRWQRGAETNFYESPFPNFDLPNLGYYRWAGVYQPESGNWGGFGFNFSKVNFGIIDWTNDLGYFLGLPRSYEYVAGLSWGCRLAKIGLKNQFFGVSAKYVYSVLDPDYNTENAGAGKSLVFDFGYLWKFIPSMRFGLNLQNIGLGQSVSYIFQPGFYDQYEEIPFTLNLALAYSKDFIADNGVTISQVKAEIRTDRKIVKNYIDGPSDPFWKAISTGFLHDTSTTFRDQLDEFIVHLGAEYTLFNTLSLRSGFLYDDAGERIENHWGFGIKALNHFQCDYYWIFSPEGYLGWLFHNQGSNGSRNYQWGINFTFFNIFKWTDADRTWWKAH